MTAMTPKPPRMSPKEKAVDDLCGWTGLNEATKIIDSIIAAAREGMVTEAQVKELDGELLAEITGRIDGSIILAEKILACIKAVDAAHENAGNSKQVFGPPPAPWTPKVGELVWCKQCKRIVAVKLNSDAVSPHCEHKQGHYTGTIIDTPHDDLRPVVASDWIVEVPGFGIVEAWYGKGGRMWIEIDGERGWTDPDKAFHAINKDWLKRNGVPIKPWKEGE